MAEKIVRKLMGPIVRKTEEVTNFSARAVKHQEKIEKGLKVKAPLYKSDQKAFNEAQKNETIREKVNKKYTELVENINKYIKITSKDPPEPPKSERPIPKGESEYLPHEKFPGDYGFIELPEDLIDKDRLMFREALEILRSRAELEPTDAFTEESPYGENLFYEETFMTDHPAVKRVDRERLERMWRYFRPFVRNHQQRLAYSHEIDILLKYIESADRRFPDGVNIFNHPGVIDRMRKKEAFLSGPFSPTPLKTKTGEYVAHLPAPDAEVVEDEKSDSNEEQQKQRKPTDTAPDSPLRMVKVTERMVSDKERLEALQREFFAEFGSENELSEKKKRNNERDNTKADGAPSSSSKNEQNSSSSEGNKNSPNR